MSLTPLSHEQSFYIMNQLVTLACERRSIACKHCGRIGATVLGNPSSFMFRM